MLNSLIRCLFPVEDDPLLNYLTDDNQRIEPEWYCPIILTILVNGSDDIGTGYSISIPTDDLREIVSNIKRLSSGLDPIEMVCTIHCIMTSLHTSGSVEVPLYD